MLSGLIVVGDRGVQHIDVDVFLIQLLCLAPSALDLKYYAEIFMHPQVSAKQVEILEAANISPACFLDLKVTATQIG